MEKNYTKLKIVHVLFHRLLYPLIVVDIQKPRRVAILQTRKKTRPLHFQHYNSSEKYRKDFVVVEVASRFAEPTYVWLKSFRCNLRTADNPSIRNKLGSFIFDRYYNVLLLFEERHLISSGDISLLFVLAFILFFNFPENEIGIGAVFPVQALSTNTDVDGDVILFEERRYLISNFIFLVISFKM